MQIKLILSVKHGRVIAETEYEGLPYVSDEGSVA